MKYLFSILFFVFVSCRNEKTKYLKKYSFFENVVISSKAKTISLNNFKSNNNKNGLEYLLDENGFLLEIRNWEKNHINGYSLRYASNNKLNIVAYFENDTMSGNYFELDTVTSKLLYWGDKINFHDGESSENQNKIFRDGKIDLTVSWYHNVRKLDNDIIHLYLPTKHQFPIAKVKILETNTDGYKFGLDTLSESVPPADANEANFYYKLKNKNSKYVTGTITYLLKSDQMNTNSIAGRTTYFKLKL